MNIRMITLLDSLSTEWAKASSSRFSFGSFDTLCKPTHTHNKAGTYKLWQHLILCYKKVVPLVAEEHGKF